MANAEPPPILIAEGIGHATRYFLREVGGVFWFIVNTFEETFERIQHRRVPFRAASFFRHTERAGVDSVPLVGLVSFFLGLTMALLTCYQLQRFGTARLIPGLQSVFQHRLSLFSRSREGFTAHSRYYHRHLEELFVRFANRRNRLLPGPDSERWRRRSWRIDNLQRRDCDHDGDRLRYTLQR